MNEAVERLNAQLALSELNKLALEAELFLKAVDKFLPYLESNKTLVGEDRDAFLKAVGFELAIGDDMLANGLVIGTLKAQLRIAIDRIIKPLAGRND